MRALILVAGVCLALASCDGPPVASPPDNSDEVVVVNDESTLPPVEDNRSDCPPRTEPNARCP